MNLQHSTTPLVVLSGLAEQEAALESVSAGAQDFISKRNVHNSDVKSKIEFAIVRHRLFMEMDNARKTAQVANQSKSEMVAMVSHEVKNPLFSITGLCELLQFTRLQSDQVEIVENIYNSARGILHIVNDILESSKTGKAVFTITNENFALLQVIEEWKTDALNQAKAKNLRLNLTARLESSDQLLGDRTRFRQILDNLTSNALKYAAAEVTISIDIRPGTSDQSTKELCVVVEDDGEGVSQQSEPYLFRSKTPIDDSKPSQESNGLGLFVVKQILDRMNGQVQYSRQGDRTRFEVTLPLLQADSKATHMTQSTALDATSTMRIANLNFVVADDNWSNQVVIRAFLHSLKVECSVCRNGQEALKLLENGTFAGLILDCNMPVLDGFSTVQKIRNGVAGIPHDIPVIAVTADSRSDINQRCADAGFDAVIYKPFTLGELEDALISSLKKHSSKNQSKSGSDLIATEPALCPLRVATLQKLNLGGESNIFAELSESFALELAACIPGMQRAIASNNLAELQFYSHKLNSVCKNIGAKAVTKILSEIETLPSITESHDLHLKIETVESLSVEVQRELDKLAR